MSIEGDGGKRRCHQCQVETTVPETFHAEPQSFRTISHYYCPECWNALKLRRQRRRLWGLIISGAAAFMITRLFPQCIPAWYILNLVWLETSIVISVVPHEFAHAFVARALGLRVFRVILGSGPKWWRGSLFGFDLEARTIPFSGVVVAAQREPDFAAWKRMVYILSGVTANALLLGVAWLAHRSGPWLVNPFSTFWIAWPAFALANGITVLVNLWPHRFHTALGVIPSDGRRLLDILLGRERKTVEDRHVAFFYLEAHTAHERGGKVAAHDWIHRGLAVYPTNLRLLSLQSLFLMNAGELGPAREINVQLLEGQPTANVDRAILLNNIAYADALLGIHLEEADRFSQEAMAIAPWARALKNTRGTVLLALNRLDEALPLLRDGLPKPEDPPGTVAECRCLYAMAEARRGNIETAERSLEIARATDPDCFLIPKTEAAIAEARVQAATPPATAVV